MSFFHPALNTALLEDEPLSAAVLSYVHNLLVSTPMRRLDAQDINVLEDVSAVVGLALSVDCKCPTCDKPDDDLDFKGRHLARHLRAYLRQSSEPQRVARADEPVRANLAVIAKALGLGNVERDVLAFIIALHSDAGLKRMTERFGDVTLPRAAEIVAVGARLPTPKVLSALGPGGRLVQSGLIAVPALADIAKPIAFLDFETINPAIPVWPGCSPYAPVPVQMSCHVLGPRGKLVHHAFLADGPEDPRPALAEAVVSACAGAATVLAYGAGFERRCIEDMARAVPRRERKLLSVARRLVDLLTIVRDHVYHPRFGGGFGLKAVLPALVRGLGYQDLDIAAGDNASGALEALLLEGDSMSARGRNKMRAQLLAYCERDTFGMVRLVERLHELA